MRQVRSLGGPDWFALGDGDLALHVLRSERLGRGTSLSQITADFASRWDIAISVLPASDQRVSTILETAEGTLDFQHYFVARRCEPVVRAVLFDGAETSLPAPGVVEAINDPRTCAIFIAPSNPYLSVDPILAIPGIKAALALAGDIG
jgi:LPPG:FO 2-phospho-L-lactate transferase